ncbi:MAG: heparinase [Erythrobacter sp. RIFCSPHIGHO2_12_FULL_63_10]|nr:MAG: heparinase [Erythrobacter sp. RIFCSPHIGHO2_12_FULL_63_10]
MATLFSERGDQQLLFDDLDHAPQPRAIPLAKKDDEPHIERPADDAPLTTSRALALSDFVPPSSGAGEKLIRLAYRMGISGNTISTPFRKPAMPRLLATVASPLAGDRAVGVALRAGFFLIHGTKTAIGQMEFASSTRLAPPAERVVHGFSWLRDVAGSAAREQCAETAEHVSRIWLDANPEPAKGAAWQVEHAGHRLLAWLVHAPLILSGRDDRWRRRMLGAMETTARWLDRNVSKSEDGLGEVSGWAAITAAGLLMPHGKPRRLYGEAGLIRSLGELVGEDGGLLSRSPLAQMEAIALLADLIACYRAVDREAPQALAVMLELLVPPLLALRHGDGGLGSWQGGGATSAERVAALIDASGVRTRPLKQVRAWGYRCISGGKTTVQFDAAPPPKPRHARWGCASTLAFEMSEGEHRLIVNCGGAALAGGLVPCRIEQGLRASAAHSTLVLDNANSTAVLLGGKLGNGVEKVELDLRTVKSRGAEALQVEASHDGYVARFGLTHRRILMLRADGQELRGEDLLVPESRKGKRGKIGFAIRFHLGLGVEASLAEDRRGAGLLLPGGSYWQLRMAGDDSGSQAMLEDSIWVDGDGRPQAIQQVVIEGMTSRSGGQFSWLLKKMR